MTTKSKYFVGGEDLLQLLIELKQQFNPTTPYPYTTLTAVMSGGNDVRVETDAWTPFTTKLEQYYYDINCRKLDIESVQEHYLKSSGLQTGFIHMVLVRNRSHIWELEPDL